MLLYPTKFKNYLHVMIMHKKRCYPIEAVLRNNRGKIIFNNREEVFAALIDLDYDGKKDLVTLRYNGYTLKMFGAIDNGDIIGIFRKECYNFLPVKDKDVIDIGANIGDSSIYFACKKAKRVIALEPYPKNYEMAKRNISINNLSDKINLMLAGCSAKYGYVTVDDNIFNDITPVRSTEDGTNIQLLALKDIAETQGIESAVLKMDCEGCEYDIILSCTEDILKKFSHIQIEYHHGYKNLRDKLEKCGFKVSATRPKYTVEGSHKMFAGWLYARLIS